MHWILTFVGGFIGAYAIVLHSGNFGSAQTGNIIEIAVNLTTLDFTQIVIRLAAVLIFALAILASYLLTNFTTLNMWKLVLWIDAIGLTLTALLPSSINSFISLYPIFFCAAFQWGTYSGAVGYSSASLFTTNNFKQAIIGWTQFFITKDIEFKQKAQFYTITVLSFFAGAIFATWTVYLNGSRAAFFVLIPLAIARVLLINNDLAIEGGTPSELLIESKTETQQAIDEEKALENIQKK